MKEQLFNQDFELVDTFDMRDYSAIEFLVDTFNAVFTQVQGVQSVITKTTAAKADFDQLQEYDGYTTVETQSGQVFYIKETFQ